MAKLVIVSGLSFAGKSTLAHALAQRLGYAEVDVDHTKIALHGPDVRDATLTRAEWDHIYAETDRHILDHLTSGTSVIDASRNFTRAERDHLRTLLAAQGYDTVLIHVTTSEAIARQRWQANRMNPSRRDVTDADFDDIIRAMEPPNDDEQPLRFHSDHDVGTWVEANMKRLR